MTRKTPEEIRKLINESIADNRKHEKLFDLITNVTIKFYEVIEDQIPTLMELIKNDDRMKDKSEVEVITKMAMAAVSTAISFALTNSGQSQQDAVASMLAAQLDHLFNHIVGMTPNDKLENVTNIFKRLSEDVGKVVSDKMNNEKEEIH